MASAEEARCLLALARGDAWPATLDAGGVDVRRVLALAGTHGVQALCWWNAERDEDGAWRAWMAPVRDEWRLALLHHGARNARLARELAELWRALAARGVEALVFKGPWLAWVAWPDPGTRPIGDVDLGVREADWDATRGALEELGYSAPPGLPRDGASALHQAHHGEQIRFARASSRPVEVHFRLVNFGPPARDEDWVWRESQSLALAGESLRHPGPTAMLLHLALHANQHAFAQLRLLHDLRFALAALATELDAEQLLRRTRDLRCAAAVYHALALAAELAGARVDPELLARLRPGALRRRWYARAWRLDLVRRLSQEPLAQRLEAPRLYLLECGSPLQKLRYLAGVARAAGTSRRHPGSGLT